MLCAFVPLVANDELIGKFITYYDAPHVFSEAEIDLAVTIARQLGFGLRGCAPRKRCVRAKATSRGELAATRQLQKISTQLIHENDTQALYEKILDAAVAIMRSDFASMQMFHPERGELRLLAHRGFDPSRRLFGSGCGRELVAPVALRWRAANDRLCRMSMLRFHGRNRGP